MNEIKVSVVCNAYNHEAYIRDALEGFVMQKTTFPFEVLVHDDASTDKTAEIIREYEQKYPEIIKPIYETENQYSKHDGSLGRIQYGRVQGDYIAICEGDDYWTDPLKLQKQFDVLESNPNIDICATAAKTERNGEITGEVAPAAENTIFTVEEVIHGGGGFVATGSLMHRASIRKNPPAFLQMMSMDYCIQIAGALRGGMIYLAEPTCVYRLTTPGSWTVRTYSSISALNTLEENLCNMLQCLDKETAGKYHSVIREITMDRKFEGFVRNRDYHSMCRPEYRSRFKGFRAPNRLVIRFGQYFPGVADFLWDLTEVGISGKRK